jgi:hypothetical protein
MANVYAINEGTIPKSAPGDIRVGARDLTQTPVTLAPGVSTTVVAASNGNRNTLAILNRGANDADLNISGAAVVGQGILVAANGGGYVFDLGAVPSNAVQAISAAGTTLIVLEG